MRTDLPARTLGCGLGLLLLATLVVACGEPAKSTDDGSGDPPGGTAKSPGDMQTPPGGMPAPEPPRPFDPDRVVATVNGEPITEREVDQALRGMLAQRGPVQQARLPQLRAQLGPRIRDQLVDRELMAQAVEKAGIEPSAEDMEARWEKIAATVPEGMTMEQYLAKSGTSREEADERLRQMVAEDMLFEEIAEGEPPTEADAKAFYEKNKQQLEQPLQVHARHILLGTQDVEDEAAKAELRKKLEAIRAELLSEDGPSFESQAKEHSTGPSAPKGGDLGFFGRGRMVPAFDEVAFELEPGEVSEIVETQFGYHLIKVEKRRGGDTPPFEELKSRILEHLKRKRLNEARTAYMKELREAATIEYPNG